MSVVLNATTRWFICALWLLSASAGARDYPLPPPQHDIVGQETQTRSHHDDTFVDIGLREGYGYTELRTANPDVDAWLPGEGTPIRLPGQQILPAHPRRGIVVNLAEKRLYYFPDQQASVTILPISIGREGKHTPLGDTTIIQKMRDPAWTVPDSVIQEQLAEGRQMPRVVPPGPDNPLGDRALRLGWPTYLIHGTDNPFAIGLRASSGCIRIPPDAMRALFDRVFVGTPVRIEHSPVKVGWLGDTLYLESYPPLPDYGNDEQLPGAIANAVRAALARRPDIDASIQMAHALSIARRFEGRPVPLWQP